MKIVFLALLVLLTLIIVVTMCMAPDVCDESFERWDAEAGECVRG